MSVLTGEYFGLQISVMPLLFWNIGLIMTAGMVGRLLAGFILHPPIKFNSSNSPAFVLSRIGSCFLFGLLGSSASDLWRLFQKSPGKDRNSQDGPTSILIFKKSASKEKIDNESAPQSYATIQDSIRPQFSLISVSDSSTEVPENEPQNLENFSSETKPPLICHSGAMTGHSHITGHSPRAMICHSREGGNPSTHGNEFRKT